MPFPIASIALSLAPFAADLVGKIVNLKKEARTKNDLNERLEKLETYEVEQAKLIEELALKVELLQKKQEKLVYIINAILVLIAVSALGSVLYYFLF